MAGTLGNVAIPCWDVSLRSTAIACSTLLILASHLTSFHVSPPLFVGTILVVTATSVYSKPDRISAPLFRGRPQFREGLKLAATPAPVATARPLSLTHSPPLSPPSTPHEYSTFAPHPSPALLRDISAPPTPPHTEVDFGDLRPDATHPQTVGANSFGWGSPMPPYHPSGSQPRLSVSPHLRRSSATDAEPTTPEIGKVFDFNSGHLPDGPGDTPAWVSMGLPDSAEAGDVRRFE